ncbi:unnamed protein product [Miscanthus lutarioriparius]|uniref:KIB1-4 beta-propeller domain-containing protein n=1 Tax=Miscanthus lutarioriparius TaxID=422564 RepID=A0A811PER1_9POAL|nr:unnamed protein product [Miscanthus lutarioriparius]
MPAVTLSGPSRTNPTGEETAMLRRASINARRRDWAKLPRDLAAEIAGCLLGIDLSEYIRFRAVCKPWRRSTDDPRLLNSRFFPRNWVLLTNYGKGDHTRRHLLNVATGASIVDDFPEFSGRHPLGHAEGLLVLSNTETSGIRLFNPLTHAMTDLPDVSSSTSISALKAETGFGTGLYYRGFGVIDGGGGGGAASPPTVVAFISGKVPLLAFIRPGESHWALADTSALTCGAHQVSVLSLRGRFYLSTSTGDVLTVELHPVPRLVHVVRNRKTAPPATTTTVPATICSFYLAPSGNDDARDAHDHGAHQRRKRIR